MITILVLNDEQRVYALVSEVLRREGYSVSNEPESAGLIKIVKKEDSQSTPALDKKIIDLNGILYRERSGEVYKSLLKEIEKPLIESVLERTEGNQLKAARILGINRNTLHSKIRNLNIDVSRWRG